MEIDHFVVLMMENRSFDHYFGWLGADADATQAVLAAAAEEAIRAPAAADLVGA